MEEEEEEPCLFVDRDGGGLPPAPAAPADVVAVAVPASDASDEPKEAEFLAAETELSATVAPLLREVEGSLRLPPVFSGSPPLFLLDADEED